MIGSVAVLLLIILNVSGRLSFSLHGMPRRARSSHRKAAEIDYPSEQAANELGVLLWAAQQADGDGTADRATTEALPSSSADDLEDPDPRKVHLLEEPPPTSARGGSSEISYASHGETDDSSPAASWQGLEELFELPAVKGSGHGGDDGILKQELLQRNLERPQVSRETSAFDGPWDTRYAMANPNFTEGLKHGSQQNGQQENTEPASHLKPASSVKRFLSGEEDTPLPHQPNCPSSIDIENLRALPFCHNDLTLPMHAEYALHPTAGIFSGRDSTAYGLPRAQSRARVRKSQTGQQNDEPDLCTPLLGVKKVALLFLTRGDLPHEDLWGSWLEAASGELKYRCLHLDVSCYVHCMFSMQEFSSH